MKIQIVRGLDDCSMIKSATKFNWQLKHPVWILAFTFDLDAWQQFFLSLDFEFCIFNQFIIWNPIFSLAEIKNVFPMVIFGLQHTIIICEIANKIGL